VPASLWLWLPQSRSVCDQPTFSESPGLIESSRRRSVCGCGCRGGRPSAANGCDVATCAFSSVALRMSGARKGSLRTWRATIPSHPQLLQCVVQVPSISGGEICERRWDEQDALLYGQVFGKGQLETPVYFKKDWPAKTW